MQKFKMPTFEVGYTPTNLRLAIALLGVTQAALARLLDVSDRTLRQWLVEDLDAVGHRDMPLKQWRKVMALLATANVV
jgi:DNA-binding XRE family transcriptional regulator